MSNYDTLNPVPSTDPRDLDDNATVFDLLLNGPNASYPDRLNVNRKSWQQMERDASALVSPNVAALAALTPASNLGFFFSATVPVTMGTYALTAFTRSLGASADGAGFRSAIGAMALTDTGAFAGSAAKLTTARTLSATGDASWSASFDGSANATATLTLATTGVAAGTYGSVTVNAKGLVTSASTATPIANGGTGATSQSAALANLGAAPLASPAFTGTPTAPTAAVGTNSTQLATAALVQAEITNKRAWTTYTPTITAASGTFTSVSATGKYMVAFGVCYFQVAITITTKGTGANAIFTLPQAALAGSSGMPFVAREGVTTGKAGTARINAALTGANTLDYTGSSGDLASGGDGSIIYVQGSYPIA